MDDFKAIADALAADIAAGRLKPGERLPPQRDFAHRRGIATSTASRVYGELTRRGLVTGEVGRGTFVRLAPAPASPALSEPALVPVDLELTFSILPEQPALMARALESLTRNPEEFARLLRPVGAAGTAAARRIAAGFLATPEWKPSPDDILFTGNGKQALAAAFAALVPPGERLGVEALTYPIVKGLASRLGITLVPVAMDERGLRADALEAVHRATPLRAVYVQPSIHNPLGITMPADRRRELAATLRRLDLPAVEDAVYAFLTDPPPPLVASAPERVVLVDTMSKRLAPGLSLGLLVPPPGLVAKVATAQRSGAWMASGLALAACTQWMADGTVAMLAEGKRADSAARQAIARERLAGLDWRADPGAYHGWLVLPEAWRAEAFAAAAARRGIGVTPAAAFTIGAGHAPNAVRLALALPDHAALADALGTLARLAHGLPSDAWGTE